MKVRLATNDEITAHCGEAFTRDMLTIGARKSWSARNKLQCVRQFISHLISRDDDAARECLAAISGNRNAESASTAASIKDSLAEWFCDEEIAKLLSVRVWWDRRVHTMDFLHELSIAFPARYPALGPRPVRTTLPKSNEYTKPVGELDWQEFADVSPNLRNAMGIKLLQDEAMEEFDFEEAAYVLGQAILRGELSTDKSTRRCQKAIAKVLAVEHAHHKNHKRPRASLVWDDAYKTVLAPLYHTETWSKAGFDVSALPDSALEASHVVQMTLRCLGPTAAWLNATKKIIATATGFNAQGVRTIRTNPYAYHTSDEMTFVTDRYMVAFKGRVERHVLAYVQGTETARGIVAVNLNTLRDKIASEAQFRDDIQHFTFLTDSVALKYIERFRQVMLNIQSYLEPSLKQFLLVALAPRKPRIETGDLRDGSYFSGRDGVSYRSVRKAVHNIDSPSVNTIEEKRAKAGHKGTGVFSFSYADKRKYLQWQQAIRFWQNCIQALMVDNEPFALWLDITFDDQQWFLTLARACGISASCGLHLNVVKEEIQNLFVFYPTNENLSDLFLTHLALVEARKYYHPRRFEMQGLPMLGLVKAIRYHLYSCNMKPLYLACAKVCLTRLALGEIRLPQVFGSR